MTILISLVLALSLSILAGSAIKRYAVWFYTGAAAIGITVTLCMWNGVAVAEPFKTWLWPVLSKGGLATALFIVVMYTGALPRGSAAIRQLMPIRAELSIIASILTLSHNASFGKYYFVKLFTAPWEMDTARLLAAICSVIMIALLIPLTVTSFRSVRRKMKPKSWKKLQRWAYLFYALIYIHVMLLQIPALQAGGSGYMLSVLAYTAIFFVYAAMRLHKAWSRNHAFAAKLAPIVCAAAGTAVIVLACMPV